MSTTGQELFHHLHMAPFWECIVGATVLAAYFFFLCGEILHQMILQHLWVVGGHCTRTDYFDSATLCSMGILSKCPSPWKRRGTLDNTTSLEPRRSVVDICKQGSPPVTVSL